ncbi:hypothetical protein GGH12_000269 [Coemansia sp. RSA 1822]|nr:hypothetical protein LPJ76_000775 [Coemansia sp. RSA 638]KAJ2545420.1 hypothetical protein GGF49_000453 [Coemansia sp. RSA 1853]KAJ2567573.1 hypothetical protein GGH12_000269 [Coemansia sp. RSA 1822]
MSTVGAYTYENLVSTANAALVGTPAFHSSLVPLLKSWRTPLGEFNTEVLGNALSMVDLEKTGVAYVQITVDALNLALTAEQMDTAFAAVLRISREAELGQLEAYPEGMWRLAQALESVGRSAVGHVRVCEVLVELVGRMNLQMIATRDYTEKPRGKNTVRPEQLAANASHGVRLTHLHIECLRQCLLAQRRDLYVRVMQNVIQVQLDAFGHLLVLPRARAFMEYHLYAGMVCVGIDELDWASRMWMLVFALPAKHTSAIQVAAYKRLMLLKLATEGKKLQLPTFFANLHTRVLDNNALSYAALADMFASKSMGAAAIKIHDMQGQLERDENWALAALVVRMMPRHFIKRVGNAYASISVAQLASITEFGVHPLASRASDPHAALVLYIQEMNDDSVVVVQGPGVLARDAVVNFSDIRATMGPIGDGTAAHIQTEQQWAELIENKVQQVDELHQYLTKLDRHLALSKEYISAHRG